MKKIASFLLAISLVFAVSACSSSSTGSGNDNTGGTEATSSPSPSAADSGSKKEQSTLDKVKASGKVVVGFSGEVPYAYKDENGKLTGEAVEVARAVLSKMGLKIDEEHSVLTEFGSLIPGLKAKRFDMITAGMFVNPKRCEQVAFADPEYKIGESLAVKQGNPQGVHSYEDIAKNKDVKVAVMTGAIEEDYMKKSGVAENQIVVVPDQPTAISELQTGRVQAITMTGPSLEAMLKSAKDTKIERVDDFKQPVIDGKEIWGYGASAFRLEDKDFRDAFTSELDKMKQNDELLNTISPFGFTKTELPGDTTAEALCKK